MLSYLREEEAANRIEKAVREVYVCGERLTPDMGGAATTQEMTDTVLSCICC
jgi:isocitrate/isopropylmalate dehydrogenase